MATETVVIQNHERLFDLCGMCLDNPVTNLETIGLGGGCHWCTEGVFQSLKGVAKVEQGWIRPIADDLFSEGVLVHFDPAFLPLRDLVFIHLLTHSSTSNHSMRGKYRSAFYAFTQGQRERVSLHLASLQAEFDQPLVTQSWFFGEFKSNSEEYLDYFYANPYKPFCQRFIEPKLRQLMRVYGDQMDWDRLGEVGLVGPSQ